MKEIYVKPEIKVKVFDSIDIITTSFIPDDDETEIIK